MDNLGSVNPSGQRPNDPIPFDSVAEPKGVSHAPLNLGGAGAAPPQQGIAPKPGASAAPATQSAVPKPVAKPAAPPAAAAAAKPVPVRLAAPPPPPAARITGVKTFFTKLHPGAISFLDEQITRWLSENPNIVVKQTNVAVGEVEAKKTEPNIIITIWY